MDDTRPSVAVQSPANGASVVKDAKKSPFGQLLDKVKQICILAGIWSDDLQRDLPKKWEKHGNMILLPENSFQSPKWRTLGPNLWTVVAEGLQCDRLGKKKRILDDDYRTPHVELLLGPDGWVEHVDNGIKYNYDVTKCMFSIGNISEKLRVASLDCKGEIVVDLFSGIGYFTLPYLIHAKAAHLYACEWNPDALEALRLNLAANKVEAMCTVLEGDCRKVCPIGVADRVNLGILPTASPYWMTACRTLKPTGGFLHLHENVTFSKLHKTASCETSLVEKTRSIKPTDEPSFMEDEELLDEIDKPKLDFDKRPSLRENSMWQTSVDSTDTNWESTERPEIPTKRRLSQQIAEQTKATEPTSYVLSICLDFQEKWPLLDASYRKFALQAARRIFAYLSNMHENRFSVKICRIAKIKSYAPRIDHVVLDLECRPVVETDIICAV